jgi:ribosome maturation factor RimP
VPDDVLAQIRDLVRPVLDQCGVELFDAQWDTRGGHATLRLVIDCLAGITLDDCERVSSAAATVLDAYDPIADAYTLEVSSPGAERPLRDLDDWRRHVGRRVNVRFRNGEAETVVEGALLRVDDDAVEVETAPRRARAPHPRQHAEDAPAPAPAHRPAVRVAVADILAARLAVEM